MPAFKTSSLLLAAAAALSLSACHSKPDKTDDSRSAEGEVLSATVSDSMVPVETPTSTPPPAPRKDVGSQAAEDATSDAADLKQAMDALKADQSGAADKPADKASDSQ
ncbi:hypothetical protein [Novosphingobium terrae]|uniref:hypothetical protein n=1 Tax=Novosphingobium terrae TaxID=2726189 RepID=UPI00197FF550|nr:hypothetical protein [Novosphingobium terrae]